jgi:5'-nucleotidase
MRLLLANDDGIYSPGLAALAESASAFGAIHIVAPDVEQSSMGHAITHSRPIFIKRTPIREWDAHRVNGTPADCVALGLDLFDHVDAVLSGINLGPNLGNGIWHSGTLAAAKQAALLGCRGIALSTPTGGGEPDFEGLRPWVDRVLELLLPQTEMKLVNVNFPPQPTGMCWTRQAVSHYDGKISPITDPYGRKLHWISVRRIDEADEGTDLWAVRNNLVSITPLRLDLTDEDVLEKARQTLKLETAVAT